MGVTGSQMHSKCMQFTYFGRLKKSKINGHEINEIGKDNDQISFLPRNQWIHHSILNAFVTVKEEILVPFLKEPGSKTDLTVSEMSLDLHEKLPH